MIDLKAFRKANHLTQIDLAEYLGVGQGFISQIEKGDRPLPKEYISKLSASPHHWDTSMLIEVKPQAPAPSQTEQVDMVIELLKAQNADLQAKVDTLNQRIGELQALLKKEREELAEIAGTSLSADAS